MRRIFPFLIAWVLWLALALPAPVYATLSASTIWEVETGGSDANNGGGFDPSQTAGMLTDGAATVATGNSPVFTSASYNFVAGDVGAWLFIASGTNWIPGWYKIASVAANAATLSAAIGAAVAADTSSSHQVFGPTTVAGCATTASPTAGTWTIDYSQQAAAQFALTDITHVTNSTATSAAHAFGKQEVGNIIVFTSGTNVTVGRYTIISVAAVTATFDRAYSSGASTNGAGGLGGALASPGQAGAVKAASQNIWIKTGTYTLSSASANVAGGTVSDSTGSGTAWAGYQTVRDDWGTAPTILVPAAGVSSVTVVAGNSNIEDFHNLKVDGAGKAGIVGFALGGNFNKAVRCIAANCTSYGLRNSGGSMFFIRCIATGCSGTAAIYVREETAAIYCEAYDNTCPGFIFDIFAHLVGCLSYRNTGGSSSGFATGEGAGNNAGSTLLNCVAYANGKDGFELTDLFYAAGSVCNCIAYGNTGVGFDTNGVTRGLIGLNNAAGSNTGGNYTAGNLPIWDNPVALSANPFTNVSTSPGGAANFSLNNTAGGGAACRAAGYPGTFPTGNSLGYVDIGGVQHQAIATATWGWITP